MDLLTTLNNITLPEYQTGLIEQRIHNTVLLQRLKPRIKRASFDAGGNLIMGVETFYPIPGGPRSESQDMPTPTRHAHVQMYDTTKEVVNVAGISRRVLERLHQAGSQSFVDFARRALDNCGRGMDVLLNLILHGDSTGRLAQVASKGGSGTSGDPYYVVVDNTRADFGWDGATMIREGMRIDIINWAGPTLRVSGLTVIRKSGNTIYLGPDGEYGGDDSGFANVADNDIVVLSGAITISGGSMTFNLPNGLLNLVDDGTTTPGPGSGRNGSWAGPVIHGLNRTTADGAHLRAIVSKASDWATGGVDGTPHEWDLEVLEYHMSLIEDGSSGGQLTAMYMSPATERALKRRAQVEMGAMVEVGTGAIIPGRYCPQYNFRGRNIPIIVVPTLPDGTIYMLDETQITYYEEFPIYWYDGFATKPWFESPGARNLMLEAWMRTCFQLVIQHGDACLRLEDLMVTT